MAAALRTLLAISGWLMAFMLAVRRRFEVCDDRHRSVSPSLPQREFCPPPPPPLPISTTKVTSGESTILRPIRTFKFKGELAFVLQEEKHRICVEVGVFEGRFSRWMLDNWRACEKYYMVDLWDAQQHYRQMDSAPLEENLRRMDIARQQVSPHAAKAVLLRNSSTVAAARFADASVDFVYLDARHTYDAVTDDLKAWWPKVAPGGILAGEDYMESDEVWQMTATCDFGPRRTMYPWSGCNSWSLPRGAYFACKARRECENVTRGSAAAEKIEPPCGSDYGLQQDGSRRRDNKAVRSAVDEFAMAHGRQVQLAYRDPQRAFMWNAWAIRR